VKTLREGFQFGHERVSTDSLRPALHISSYPGVGVLYVWCLREPCARRGT